MFTTLKHTLRNSALSIAISLSLSTFINSSETVLLEGFSGFEKSWIGHGKKEIVQLPEINGYALRLITQDIPSSPTKSQTFASPMLADVTIGSHISVSFTARCTRPNGGSLIVNCGINSDPWTPIIYKEFQIYPEWRQYQCDANSTIAIPAGSCRFGFHFGHQAQIIEISNLKVTVNNS